MLKNVPSYETGNENKNVAVAYLKKKIGKYISNKTWVLISILYIKETLKIANSSILRTEG